MDLTAHFVFCPRCGAADLQQKAPKYFVCAACNLRFYLNPAPAAGGIIADDTGRILLIRRAKEPGKDKFAIPGGFVDEGETVEDTVRREVFEEVGLNITALRFLCSFPNRYQFGECIYSVLDFFFVCQVSSLETRGDVAEVSDILWLAPHEINLDEVAFPSVRRALELYRASL
jgi:ADP-ribose pyrophosphatase YjhB (NUDIX family)